MAYVTSDAEHNATLKFESVRSPCPGFTVEVTGPKDDLIAYIRDYYSEGDEAMAAELIAAIREGG